MAWERNENKVLEKYEFKTDREKVVSSYWSAKQFFRATNQFSFKPYQEPELMITLSMPVFNITNGTQTSWDLIGVAGLDVPISEILNEIPFYRVSISLVQTK